jgi:hypothetical protein
VLEGRSAAPPVDLADYGYSDEELAEMGLNDSQGQEEYWNAVRIWNEYAMQQTGVSYPMQGYSDDGVTVWAKKLDEHVLCASLLADAEREKSQHG